MRLLQPAAQMELGVLDTNISPRFRSCHYLSCGHRFAGGHGYLSIGPGQRVVALVNSLGATPQMELLVIARRTASNLMKRGAIVERIYCGAFMTSLDMAGASVSVMKADNDRLSRYAIHPSRSCTRQQSLEHRCGYIH